MINFLEYITDSPIKAIVIIVLFALAIKGFYEFIAWIKKELDKWYETRNTKEKSDSDIEQRIADLEESDKQQLDRLNSIDATLQNISACLETLSEEERKNIVSTSRSALWRWYLEFQDKEYLTSAEYEMFMSLSERYLNNGGNSVFRTKIIPEIEAKPIKN